MWERRSPSPTMDEGLQLQCERPPGNPTVDDLDVSFISEPRSRTSSILIHLHHEGERWERLRDRMMMLRPEMHRRGTSERMWGVDEVFIGFLLDRLEKDLDSCKEGGLSSDRVSPAGLKIDSRHPEDITVRTVSELAEQNQILSADNSSGSPENEDSPDGEPMTEAVLPRSVSDGQTSTVAEAEALLSDEPHAKEDMNCPPLCPESCAPETLQDDQARSRLSLDSGNKNMTVSSGTSSDDTPTGTGSETGTHKERRSSEDKADEAKETEGRQGDQVRIKRGRGRPRKEVNEDEMKALMFNKRLREIQRQDLPRMFSCRSCGEKFKEAEDLRIHTITAHLPISIPDSSGNTIKENGEILFTHIEIDLGLYQQVSEVDIRELSIELRHCPECNEFVENIKTHLEIHMKKNYICEECGKGFATRRELQMHNVHHKIDRSGVMPYSCRFCDKTFRTAQSLSIHWPLHNKARNFVCQQCGKTFKANARLQKHLGTHAENKRYSCSICGRGFAQKCNMTRHQRTHTGEKPYQCHHCHQSFSHNISLTKHLKKEHSVQVVNRIQKTVEEIDNFPTGRMSSKRVSIK